MILQDKFNRFHDYLRISITDACNFRCTYCTSGKSMPVLPSARWMKPEEIEEIARVFVMHGVKKIRITGGEPLIRKDAADIFYRLAALNVSLAVTTNGVFLPKFLPLFKEIGLSKINVSLDSLDPLEFYRIVGVDDFEKVKKSIFMALEMGFQVKINAVPTKSTKPNEIWEFLAWTKNNPLEMRFIEMMPFTGNDWDRNQVLEHDELLTIIQKKYQIKELPFDIHETARIFQMENHVGTLGIISTVTKPFCTGCTRLRITADGKIKNCLFGMREDDLLGALRAGESLDQLIQQNVQSKFEQTGGQILSSEMDNRSMIHIGG